MDDCRDASAAKEMKRIIEKRTKRNFIFLYFFLQNLKAFVSSNIKRMSLIKRIKKCKHASNQAYQSKFEDISICSLSYLILINRKFNLPETKTLLRKRISSKDLKYE